MPLTDWRGNQYDVGDTIIYGSASSSYVYMHEGIVIEIGEEPNPYTNKTKPYLKVRKMRSSGHDHNQVSPMTPSSKPSKLTNLCRVTKIEE